MKRDMELCREILFAIEKQENPIRYEFTFKGYDQYAVTYNCRLLYDAGLIDKMSVDLSGNCVVGNLTWAGHDFLDKVRETTVWNKTKDIISKKGLPMIVDVVKQVATAIITSMTEGAVKAILEKGDI